MAHGKHALAHGATELWLGTWNILLAGFGQLYGHVAFARLLDLMIVGCNVCG